MQPEDDRIEPCFTWNIDTGQLRLSTHPLATRRKQALRLGSVPQSSLYELAAKPLRTSLEKTTTR